MPSILTIKQQEAQDSCDKMNQMFMELNTQINVTHNNGFVPLDNKATTEQNLQHSMLDSAIDMNDLPKQ